MTDCLISKKKLKAVHQMNDVKEEEICKLQIKAKKIEQRLQTVLNAAVSICQHHLNDDVPLYLPEFLICVPGGSRMKSVVDANQRETKSNVVEQKELGNNESEQDGNAGFHGLDFSSDETSATVDLPHGAWNGYCRK